MEKIKEEAYLEAHQTKNTTDRKTGRKIFLQHPKLQRALSDYIKCESDESKLVSKRPLFISARGLSISADSMVHIIKRIYKRHGLHTLSSHSGRRYFATMLREEFPDMNAKELQDYGVGRVLRWHINTSKFLPRTTRPTKESNFLKYLI